MDKPTTEQLRLAAREAAREAAQAALAEVYIGATFIEADALLDQLEDRGFQVVQAR